MSEYGVQLLVTGVPFKELPAMTDFSTKRLRQLLVNDGNSATVTIRASESETYALRITRQGNRYSIYRIELYGPELDEE